MMMSANQHQLHDAFNLSANIEGARCETNVMFAYYAFLRYCSILIEGDKVVLIKLSVDISY